VASGKNYGYSYFGNLLLARQTKMKLEWFKKYLLPGLIFQSVTIGGGYGTGRELVEFFLTQGPRNGYFGMITSMVVWGLVMAISFELARIGNAYNYRTFLRALLGKGWGLYEALYLAMMILVISVVGSAANQLLNEMFGVSELLGTVVIMVIIAIIAFFGGKVIERLLSFWSIALYVVYIILFVVVWNLFDQQILEAFSVEPVETQWFLNGLRYAGYNIAAVPALLYSVSYIETRKEAILAGIIAGMIGIIPAFLFYTALLSHHEVVLNESIPANFILGKLDNTTFQFVFQIVLLGTFIETGVGFIHGFNERIAGVYLEKGKEMPHWLRLVIALILFIVAIYIANTVGLVGLIAEGYGTITWGFWIIFVVPVLTYGLWRIVKTQT
jgi:uncharacterized membrane protein YkvI